MYGITETGSWVVGPDHSKPEVTPADGLIGVGWGAEVLITSTSAETDGTHEPVPDGEKGYIWLRTPTIMQSYFGKPKETDAVIKGTWFFTGDLGYKDTQGRLRLTGRVRNEIVKGGIKISPEELDLVAEDHPAILEACAFAIEDKVLGENIGICVAFDRRKRRPKISEIKEWFSKQLSAHKTPLSWYEVDSVPRTSRGKVSRAEVSQLCTALKPIDM
jgi:acyl-CoA synthetase (AMP-forming)/AMP-acid ligase II